MEPGEKNLEKLWLRYVEGRATPKELNDLFDSLQDPAWEAVHAEWAQRAAMRTGRGLPADPSVEAAVWQQLLSKADGLRQAMATAPARPLSRVRLLRKWGWAASVAFILAIGGYVWTSNRGNPSTDTVAAVDIVPGSDGAILTLADGTRVVLDSVADGVIASRHGTEVLLKDNALTYDPDGTADTEAVYHTVTTPNGRQFRLILPDGTRVWLNAASSIRYPTVFSGPKRLVAISGEAYFEVARNAKMPFHVNVNDQAYIDVLGTHFNVNAYEREGSINTTLLEGSVRVSDGVADVTLTPGQQAQLADGIRIVDDVDTSDALAWKNGLFNFDGQPLRVVMRQLERWYDIEVAYDGSVRDVIFRGKVFRNLEFADMQYILRKMGVKFKVEGRTLTVMQ